MMIYHKMPMSGVYENVFQTSEISILPSLSNELLFTLCLRTPSNFLNTFLLQELFASISLRTNLYRTNVVVCACPLTVVIWSMLGANEGVKKRSTWFMDTAKMT